jgi:peptidyl-prolyl cis-trans isomerase SurA
MIVFLLYAMLADQIAAYVGDEIILESEVFENMTLLASDPAARGMFTTAEEMRNFVLDQLIAQKLLLNEAEKESIVVTDEEIETIVEQSLNEVKARYPSEADFMRDLEKNGLTLEELRKYNADVWRVQLITQRLIEKKIGTKITISPIAMQRFYEENKDSIALRPDRVKLAHILMVVKPSEAEQRKAFEKALDVYKLIQAGGDFAVLAQEFSDDRSTKSRGGMMGRIQRGETLEEFEGVVFGLKPGDVSQPFQTRRGYHIVEVLNKGEGWVLARQILIAVEVTKADTLRFEERAHEYIDRITNGANFDSLARAVSDDPNIDLGEIPITVLTPPLDTVVENLDVGELSEPMMTPYGLHQIYVRERISEEPLTFEDLRNQIYQYLYRQEQQKYSAELIADLEQSMFIRRFPREF